MAMHILIPFFLVRINSKVLFSVHVVMLIYSCLSSCVDLFLLFMFRVCLYYSLLSVPCYLGITCWEMAFLCVMFPIPISVNSRVVSPFREEKKPLDLH